VNANDDLDLTPEQARIRDAVGRLPSAEPDPAFRARLRVAFVAGTIAPRLRVVESPWRRRAIVWGGFVAAAAAAVIVAGLVLGRSSDYRLVASEGAGVAMVNDAAIPMDHAAELARALRRGGHVVVPKGATIDIAAPGVLAMTLSGGSDVVVPPAPPRIGERHAQGRVTLGDLFIATGPDFHGATLDVVTSEANAHVTGTSLAVLRDEFDGTCVCVMNGVVAVTANGEAPVKVPAGMRIVVPIEGRPEMRKIRMRSEHALHRLHSMADPVLGR
jgi:hypothetical protein